MDFNDAASYFDDDPVYDGYTGALLFHGHTTAHDDHTSSGATSRRRTLTTTNDTAPPPRAVVNVYGEPWIITNSNPDGFQGDLVRRSYGLKKSTGLMVALTPGQAALNGAGAASFHAHKEYFRDNQDARDSADWDTMWNVFYAPGEPVKKGTILRQGTSLLRVRNTYPSIEDLNIAEADQLDDDAFQVASFTTTKRDLITELPVTATLGTTVIQTDVTKNYKFRTLAESDTKPGDVAITVAKSALTPAVGTEVLMMSLRWRVLTVVPEGDAWTMHARLA